MNKHLYRIVFNHALGLFQAASELVRRPGRGASSCTGARTAAVRPVSFSLWVALGFVGVASVASAQIAPDMHAPGNQRPTVLGAPDSAPLINIQTPSAAGVSRNTYAQLDVDQRGAVLNNSRTNTTTQLAGTIGGNPWLATGTAKVILNEVTGANPSQLNGYIEVAGDRAQVIIANPAGIACNGCGFLNANRVTLTTGTPVLSGGSLDGYRVSRGAVQIGNNGMDASRADYTDIIARAVQVNGGMWSPQLQVTTGANQVSADQTHISAITGSGDQPALALDVSALGGMYANKITLVGTEQGVGVRNAGAIGAQADALVVTVEGLLQNTGTLQSQTDTQINASGGVANAGTISANRELFITTPVDVDNSGGVLNAGRIAVEASSLRNAGGTIAQTGSQGMALEAGALSNANGGRMGVADEHTGSGSGSSGSTPGTDGGVGGGGTDGGEGDITGGGNTLVTPIALLADGLLRITGLLDNDGGRISAAAGFDLASSNGLTNDGGQLALRQLTLTGGNLSNQGGTLYVDGASTVHANQLINDGGSLTFAEKVSLDAQSLSNRAGTLFLGDASPMTLSIAGSLDNTDGTLATNASQFALSSGALVNAKGVIQHAGTDGLALTTGSWRGAGGIVATAGAATITAGIVDHRGATLSAAQLNLNATSIDNRGGTLVASGEGGNTLTVSGTLDNSDEGTLASNGDLRISANTLGNAKGTVQQAGEGTLRIDAATLNGAGGTLASNGTLQLAGTTTDLSDGTTVAQTIRVRTGTLSTAGGSLTALSTNALDLYVRGGLNNAAGSIATNGSLQLNADALTNTDGTLIAAGTDTTRLDVGRTFDNTRGTFATAGATTINTGSLINQGGTVQATSASPLTLNLSDALVNDQGVLASNGDVLLHAWSVSNASGTVQTPGALQATVFGMLDNSGGALLAGGALTVRADGLRNRDTVMPDPEGPVTGIYGQTIDLHALSVDNTHGQVQASGALTLSGDSVINATGTLDGQGAVSITGLSLDNTGGQIVQRGDDGALTVSLQQALINTNGGRIGAEGITQLYAGFIDNTGGAAFAFHDLTLSSKGDFRNSDGGVLQTGGALTLNVGGTLNNTAGQIDATGAANVTASTLINQNGGLLLAGAEDNDSATLTVTAATIDNRGGILVNRGGDLIVQATAVDNSDKGTLVAQRDLTLNNVGTLTNTTGGTVYATRHLIYQNGNATLDNTGGTLGAGDTAWLALGAITNNDGGKLQANTLWLTTPTLTNNGGEVLADTLHATLFTLNGIGRLYGAQQLDVHFIGDYTHLAGQRLESDGVLGLTVDGTLINQGTLQSPGELDVTAANIVNTAGAVINASNDEGSALAKITASGSIDNQKGASLEGDTLVITGSDVTNTGDIVGDVVQINANTLTNGRDLGTATAAVDYGEGFIGASQAMSLYINTLWNLDGQLYSGGDLTIARDASGNQGSSVLNNSGRIQAENNLSIAAQQITNQRRVFQTETVNLTPAEQAQNSTSSVDPQYQYNDTTPAHRPPNIDPSQVLDANELAKAQAYCDSHNWDELRCIGYPQGKGSPVIFQSHTTTTVTSYDRVTATSASGQIVSGSDMTLIGTVTNDKSAIAAGRDLAVYDPSSGAFGIDSVHNIAWAPTVQLQTITELQTQSQYLVTSPSRTWLDGDWWTYDTQTTASSIVLASGQVPSWITLDVGSGLPASMTANGAVTIIGGNVTNAVVGNGDGFSSNGPGGKTPLPTDNGLHTAGNAYGGSAKGPNGAATGQTLGDVSAPLPGYVPPSNGMFKQNADPNAPFLVNTAPRFAKGPVTSSDYLLRALGQDPSYVHKRLGDGYYEQNLVLDQILQLTGRRTLNGGDAMGQYNALMDGAATEASRLGLSLGAPLTDSQIAALSTDIVWLVDQVVNGEHVLVPVVYLSKATSDHLKNEGALIGGDQAAIQSTGTVRNDGTLTSERGTWLSADTLINTGAMSSGGTLAIASRNDTINAGTLSGGAVSVAAGRDLVTTGSITSSGDMALLAGRDMSIGVAPVQAGGNLAMVAGRDLTATASTIHAGGDATVMAGNNLTLDATARTTRTQNGQTTEERLTYITTSISAGGNLAVVAGDNLTSNGAQLSAGNQLGVAAGNDMMLNAVTDTQTKTSRGFQGRTVVKTSDYDETLRGTTLSGTNGVVATAGHDLIATGAVITSAHGNVALGAGNDLTLNAGTETHTTTVDTKTTSGNWNAHSTTRTHDSVSDTYAVGTAIGGNHVQLIAGHDLTAQAATVVADGSITAIAGHDINVTDAHDVHSEEHDVRTTSSRLFNTNILDPRFGNIDPDKRSSHSSQRLTQSTSVGTLLSGDSVTLAAGHDINGTNAQIVGTHEVVMAAGNNLTLTAGQNTYSETDSTTKSHTGVMNGGGLSVMAGKRTTKTTTTIDEVSYSGSLVGSVEGGVTMSAGNNVHITGSDVLSQTGTVIVGKNVTIDAAVGTTDITQTYKQSQAGIHAGVGGVAATVANSVIGNVQRGREVNDPRLKALYAAKIAYDAYDLGSMSGTAAMEGASDSNPNGISLQLGIGASSASSKTTTHDESAYGSTIRSNGNVVIAATDGSLNVIGSQISGDNVGLFATDQINLLSQAENHTLQSNNKNASGEVGVQIGTDGVGFYAQASVGGGNAHGNGTTHATTSVDAKNTLTLISGGDTTIKGAQAQGNAVLADIGGNLSIVSEQDTDDFASKQMQASGKVVVGMGAGGSASYNQSNTSSHYASVTTVSGIGAGDGGFNIRVNGNTDLKGRVIASTADASKNLLDTGSLTFSDIHNEAKYSASSFGVSGGTGGGGAGVAPNMGIPQSDSSHSTTKAGIANGTIITRNGDTDLSGLNRNPDINVQGLTPIFDLQKVQEKQEMGQLAGQVGYRAAGDIAGKMGWAEGSPERTILHGVVGAGVAALGGGDVAGGAAGAAANQLAINYMAQYLVDQGYEPTSAEFATMLQLGSVAIGAVVGGGTGAATALDGTQYNYLTHLQVEDLQKKIAGCNGDRVCIESAKSAAETISAQQEQDLMSGCAGPLGHHADACKGAILDAYAYAKDPLASQLGLRADQAVTTQNYVANQYWWGMTVGNNAASNDGNKMVGLAVMGATAGLSAGPGLLAASAYEGIQGGSLLQFALATRSGTGLMSGGVNLGTQLAKTGGDITQVNPIDVGASVVSGYLGFGGGVRWNGLVGFGVGIVQTEANNLYSGQNNSLLIGGLTGSATTVIGVGLGDSVMRSLQTPVFAPLSAVLWGNVVGAGGTEGANWINDKLQSAQGSQHVGKQ